MREKKVKLIALMNPTWDDLSEGWDFLNRYKPSPEAARQAEATLGRVEGKQVLRFAQDDKEK